MVFISLRVSFINFVWLILVWINNNSRYYVYDEIIYLASNINSATSEVLEWISDYIPHIAEHVITYNC